MSTGSPVLAEPPPARIRLLPRLGVVLGTPLLALLVLYLAPRRVDLELDNGGPAAIAVFLDGEPLGEVPAGAVRRFEGVRAGARRLVARGGGEEHRLEADLAAAFFAPRPTWVWNVGGRTRRYWVLTQGYGEVQAEVVPLAPFAPPGELFSFPPAVLAGVNAPLPAEVQVPRGQTGAVRSVLWTEAHLKAERDRRLLEAAARAEARAED